MSVGSMRAMCVTCAKPDGSVVPWFKGQRGLQLTGALFPACKDKCGWWEGQSFGLAQHVLL